MPFAQAKRKAGDVSFQTPKHQMGSEFDDKVGQKEAGFRALSEMQDQDINMAANALSQSVDHHLPVPHAAPFRALLLPGLRQPGGTAHRSGGCRSPYPTSRSGAIACVSLISATSALPCGQRGHRRQRCGRRRQATDRHHRGQPGRKDNVVAGHRAVASDDAVRHARRGVDLLFKPLRGPVHALQARGGHQHDQRQA